MSLRHQKVAVSTASLLYGVISILAALLGVTAKEFTSRNVVLGGATLGIAAMMTYYFKEVVHREADAEETLDFVSHLREIFHALPVLIFPVLAISIAVGGLETGLPATTLIKGLFYLGLATVCAAAFFSSYFIHESVLSASLRTLIWIAICLILLLIKKAA